MHKYFLCIICVQSASEGLKKIKFQLALRSSVSDIACSGKPYFALFIIGI